MEMKAKTGLSEERELIRKRLIKSGDKLKFSTKVYNKLRRILIEENRDARIEGIIKKNEVLFQSRKSMKKNLRLGEMLNLFFFLNCLYMTYKDVEQLPHVFEELNKEVDKTAQLFARGYEYKEICSIKCRAYGTILNQINTAFNLLKIRNGRELSIKYSERVTGKSILDLSDRGRSILSIILLCVFLIGMTENNKFRRRRVEEEVRVTRISVRRARITD